MKRYKTTINGKSILLYGNSLIDIKTLADNGAEITEYKDNNYMTFIEQIKSNGEFLGYDYKRREVYKLPYSFGEIECKLSKIDENGLYYDFAMYRVSLYHRAMNPVCFTLSTPERVCRLLQTPAVKFEVYSHRQYGEPRLEKPKELKNIRPVTVADFIPKKCACLIFIKDNDVWVKHNDYLSSTWKSKSADIGMPLESKLKKYFNKSRKKKFIYGDCWGSVVLRNEAWVVLRNIIPYLEATNPEQLAREIVLQQGDGSWTVGTELEWERFWVRVVKSVRTVLGRGS